MRFRPLTSSFRAKLLLLLLLSGSAAILANRDYLIPDELVDRHPDSYPEKLASSDVETRPESDQEESDQRKEAEKRQAQNLFAVRDWQPPPPPMPVNSPPPPPPGPPPLPYRFMARIVDAETRSSLFALVRDNQMVMAKVGDTLDGTYKLESADKGQLVFLFLPMSAKQSIYLGPEP